MRKLTNRQSQQPPGDGVPVERIVASDRRRGGYGYWRLLAVVRPEGSRLLRHGDEWVEASEVAHEVPAGIAYIRLELRTLTSTVTALTAQFGLDDDRAHGLEGVLKKGTWLEKGELVEEWRTSLRHDAADWLAKWFPGSFHRLAPGQLPTIEFLLTGQVRPWEPEPLPTEDDFKGLFGEAGRERDQAETEQVIVGTANEPTVYLKNLGPPDVGRELDLRGRRGYWQCATIPSLRLQERSEVGWRAFQPGQRHCLVLAALEQEFIADPAGRYFMADPAHSGGSFYAAADVSELHFAHPVGELLVRWSLTAFIRELEGHIADIQDAADQASRERSAQALADTQQQLLQTGIDSRIVVNDILRYAGESWWAHNVLDFTEVQASPLVRFTDEGASGPQWSDTGAPTPLGEPLIVSLAESLRTGQIADGERISQLETDLHEVLNTSANLASASENLRLQNENLRLQNKVVRFTVIAIIVAIIAVAVAVMTPILS